MGDTQPNIESVLVALLTLVRVLNDTNITEELTQVIESTKPVVKKGEEALARARIQKKLDDFEPSLFHPADWNRRIYACSVCHLSGHTKANHKRPCRHLEAIDV